MLLVSAWSGCKMAEKTVIALLWCIELLTVQAFKEGSFMTGSFDASQNNKDYGEGVFVQSTGPTQEALLKPHPDYSVSCGKDAIEVILPSGRISEVTVLGMYSCWFYCFFFSVYIVVSLLTAFNRIITCGPSSRSNKVWLLPDKGTGEQCGSCWFIWLSYH